MPRMRRLLYTGQGRVVPQYPAKDITVPADEAEALVQNSKCYQYASEANGEPNGDAEPEPEEVTHE